LRSSRGVGSEAFVSAAPAAVAVDFVVVPAGLASDWLLFFWVCGCRLVLAP
jgi:hypothetical protein